MRILALFISLCALSQAASAQSPECKAIANPAERLACYDKSASAEKPVARPAVNASKVDASKYVDSLSAEDARMNARLKTICRGC